MNHMTGFDLAVSINDLVLTYDDLGSGAIPVIFIHGFPFDKSMWQYQLDALRMVNRVIAYDIRGFGKSESGTEEAGMNRYADDLIAFMDALKIEKAVLCGLSMGGYIVLNAISRYPQRFEAVILCDTQCIADSSDARESRMKTIAIIKEGGKATFADAFIKKMFFSATYEINPNLVQRIRETIMATSDTTIIAALQALAEREETCSILNSIKVPSLIICGNSDVVTPLEQSRLMHSRIAGASIQIIHNAGHLSNLDQPVEFTKQISGFLNALMK